MNRRRIAMQEGAVTVKQPHVSEELASARRSSVEERNVVSVNGSPRSLAAFRWGLSEASRRDVASMRLESECAWR